MNSVVHSITIVLMGVFSFLLWRRSPSALQKFFWPALLIKLLAGIALGLVYTYYYQANDTFKFFTDAKILAASARSDFASYLRFLWSGNENSPLWNQLRTVEPRSLFFVKGLSVASLVTNDNYWISSLWFSFFSFTGCWYLFIRLNTLFKAATWAAALSLFFFPSFVFWSSGIVKESIAAGGLCFIAGVFLLGMSRRKPLLFEWIGLLISFYAMWTLKYYWAAILIPTLITSLFLMYVIERFMIIKSRTVEAVAWISTFSALCIGVSFIHPNFHLDRLLHVIVENNEIFMTISAPGDAIHFDQLNANWYSVALNAPWALFSGLFRPFVWEADTLFQYVIGFENLVLLLFFVFTWSRIRLITHSPHRLIIYSGMVYVSLLCIFLALSTPNFGTLSRYRIGFLPVFCFLLFDQNPLWSKVLRNRK